MYLHCEDYSDYSACILCCQPLVLTSHTSGKANWVERKPMALRSSDRRIDPDLHVNILLIGDHGVGKTQLLQKFASGASFSNRMLTSRKFCNCIGSGGAFAGRGLNFFADLETHVDQFFPTCSAMQKYSDLPTYLGSCGKNDQETTP